MHDSLFRAATVACDAWQNIALVALIGAGIRQHRRVRALERRLDATIAPARYLTEATPILMPPPNRYGSFTVNGVPPVAQ